MNKFVEVMFHTNAVVMCLLSFLAYWTPNGMLLATLLFLVAISTEIAYILFKEETDKLWATRAGYIRRQVKKLNKKKQEFVCNECKRHLPVMK